MSVLIALHPVDGVIGTIAYAPSSEGTGHIRGMAVSPHWQGQNVSAQLLHQTESAMRQRGCGRATLDTSYPLRRALRFYYKQGYHPSGRTEEFYGMELIELVKKL
jgi:GNAT superfamily N-acetyltransferase